MLLSVSLLSFIAPTWFLKSIGEAVLPVSHPRGILSVSYFSFLHRRSDPLHGLFVVIFNMVTKLPPPVLFVLNSYDCLLFTLYFSLILGTLKSPFQCITLWKWPSPCGSLILLLVSFPVHFSNYLSANVWDFSFLSVGNIALSNLP